MQKKKKTWIITGASSGVGREFCRQLLEAGDNVIALSRNNPNFLNPNLLFCSVDVTNPKEVKAAIQKGLEKFGKIDIVVNNAGISRHCTVEEENINDIKNLFEVNFYGTLNVIKEILPYFRANKKGVIINNSSMNGIGCRPYGCAYVSSKHAVEGLTKVLRHETKSFCKVMCFELGYFKSTGIVKNAKKENSNIEEYQKLKSCCFKIKSRKINDLEKAVTQIIKQTNKRKLPAKLILGYDALNVVGYEICSLLKDYFKSFGYTRKSSSKDIETFNFLDNKCDYLIVNFWDTLNNYGACLTAFAMQELIKSFNQKPLLLDTGERTKLPEYSTSISKNFSDNYLDIISFKKLKNLKNYTSNIKGVVLGSDQVLRLEYMGKNYNKYLLNFVDNNCRKLAISSSFGLDKNDFLANKRSTTKNISFMKKALKSFDFLSCRETSGMEIYRDIFGLNSDLILDPVFLIDKSKYNNMIEKSENDYSNKIVTYILDKKENQNIFFENISKKLDLAITTLDIISNNHSVSDWLKAISQCSIFITDSFHGVCFALIFNKPFICIKNKNRGSARFDSLIELFDIEKNFIASFDEIKNIELFFDNNWTNINDKLHKEKTKSLKILKDVLTENYSNNDKKQQTKIRRMSIIKKCYLSLIILIYNSLKILNAKNKTKYIRKIKTLKHCIEWGF